MRVILDWGLLAFTIQIQPPTKTNNVQSLVDNVTGAAWSLISDLMGNVMVNSGSTGVRWYNPVPSRSLETLDFQLIDNNPPVPKTPNGLAALLTSIAALAFSIVTFDPAAASASITGIVLASAGAGEAADATGSADNANNQPDTTPTTKVGSD